MTSTPDKERGRLDLATSRRDILGGVGLLVKGDRQAVNELAELNYHDTRYASATFVAGVQLLAQAFDLVEKVSGGRHTRDELLATAMLRAGDQLDRLEEERRL